MVSGVEGRFPAYLFGIFGSHYLIHCFCRSQQLSFWHSEVFMASHHLLLPFGALALVLYCCVVTVQNMLENTDSFWAHFQFFSLKNFFFPFSCGPGCFKTDPTRPKCPFCAGFGTSLLFALGLTLSMWLLASISLPHFSSSDYFLDNFVILCHCNDAFA